MSIRFYAVFLFLILMVSSAITDIDWMVVSYRYSEWHRSQELWEFCPFLKLNWWLAYAFTVLRIVFGSFILGALCAYKEVKAHE